jgi:predicted aldo/keto reductase-like oxidoreductase
VRFIGFSAHSVDAALQALDQFDFDSVLMPFNVTCIENGNFGMQVIEKAQQMGTARMALKAIAWSPVPKGEEKPYAKCWYKPIQDRELARLALAYVLDLPMTATVPPGDENLYQMVTEIALGYKPLTDEERQQLLAQVQGVEPIFRHEA